MASLSLRDGFISTARKVLAFFSPPLRVPPSTGMMEYGLWRGVAFTASEADGFLLVLYFQAHRPPNIFVPQHLH